MNVTIQSANPFTFWGLGNLELTSNMILFIMYIEGRIKTNSGERQFVQLVVSRGYQKSDQVLTLGLETAATRWNTSCEPQTVQGWRFLWKTCAFRILPLKTPTKVGV